MCSVELRQSTVYAVSLVTKLIAEERDRADTRASAYVEPRARIGEVGALHKTVALLLYRAEVHIPTYGR